MRCCMALLRIGHRWVQSNGMIIRLNVCYVAGMVRLMDNDEHTGPINIGNPTEFTMLELANVVKEVVNPDAEIVFRENTADDPNRRKPDITKACIWAVWSAVARLSPRIRLAQLCSPISNMSSRYVSI